MALVLNIDTATEFASIALCEEGQPLAIVGNNEMRDHASWIHKAIAEILESNGKELKQLCAIAVTAGPGSYTGLRVGMASAKGLCFVLNIPLITENTLKVMAQGFLNTQGDGVDQRQLLVPMIDARRMEVFTAVYDVHLAEILSPTALILEQDSFNNIKTDRKLICFGNGSSKFESIAPKEGFEFRSYQQNANALGALSYQKFKDGQFADLAYVEPLYLKDFYSPPKK